jgi:hypothetical protein
VPEPSPEPPRLHRWSDAARYAAYFPARENSLSNHVKALRGRTRHTSPRWLGLAILVGAITAIAVVSFLIS